MPNRCSLYRSASLCFFLRIPGLSLLSSLFLFLFGKHLCVYRILTPFFLIIIIYNERFLSGVMELQNNVIYGFKRTVPFFKFKFYTCQFFRQAFYLTWQYLVEASAFIYIQIQIIKSLNKSKAKNTTNEQEIGQFGHVIQFGHHNRGTIQSVYTSTHLNIIVEPLHYMGNVNSLSIFARITYQRKWDILIKLTL